MNKVQNTTKQMSLREIFRKMVFYKYKFWSIIKSFLINKGHFSREGMIFIKTDNETMYIILSKRHLERKKVTLLVTKKTSDTTKL